MSTTDGYVPGRVERDYIESIGRVPHAALLAIEQAAEPENVPILDRAGGRVLAALAANRRRIVEVGTAFGYSTLWMALAQPAGGTIVTLDPDESRTSRARAWWRQAGIPDEQVTVINRPALEAFAAGPGDPAAGALLQGPFDLVFIDALKDEYQAYLEALRPRLAPGALIVADNVLWSGATADPVSTRNGAAELRAFNAAVLADPGFVATVLPVGDGMLVATVRG
ncbi:MAG TPA: O-methyltransferase [Candidatus Limnocylindrales bacterium]|jgi:caffeoyl-CoA O-methyltransferase